MDKEKLNSKLKEMKKQAGVNAQKTKDNLGKVFDKESVKENLNKAKKGVEKAVDVTMNSKIIKKMNPDQKLAMLGISTFVVIVIIALLGRFIFSSGPSIWCVVTAPKTTLSFHSSGEVSEVAYSEKQTITRGATIARLVDKSYIEAFETANAKSMEANLRFLNMENRLEDMENALAEIKVKAAERASEVAIAAYELATAYENQYKSYFEESMISEAQYNASLMDMKNAEDVMNKMETELENARKFLETSKLGYSPEEIAAAKDEAEALTAQTDRAKADVDGTSILAPFSAYINNISIKAGDTVGAGAPVCELIDMDKIWLRGLVNKSAAESLKPGSAVSVQFREISNETFAGKIISVNTSNPAEQKGGENLYELRIELDKPNVNIMPEMEAVAIVVS